VNRRRKEIGGTAVDRVRAKIAESKFFIDEMDKRQHHAIGFGYCLSAFLSAFKSIEYQLPKRTIKALRHSDEGIDFLMNQRNIEVHGAGVEIVFVADLIRVGRFHSRFEREPHRFHNPRLPPGTGAGNGGRSWRFTGKRSADLIGYCTECVNSVEKFVEGLPS
jgi:hypothetical protein